MDVFEIQVGFYTGKELVLKMTFEEYQNFSAFVSEHAEMKEFICFDYQNGSGNITFKPINIAYIKY